jgi:hypothetical protein
MDRQLSSAKPVNEAFGMVQAEIKVNFKRFVK